MQPLFTFQPSPLDEKQLCPQVSRALKKRAELLSRQKCPQLWKWTDKLNGMKKAPLSTQEHRKKRLHFWGLLHWLLGFFLLLPGLIEPQKLFLILLAGAACFGIGIVILWNNKRTFLGIASLLSGAILCIGALGNPNELGKLLMFGILNVSLGIVSLFTRSNANTASFDRAAQQLLQRKAAACEACISFSAKGIIIRMQGNVLAESHIPYSCFEMVVETEDLLLPIYQNTIILLQKKDLTTGTLPALQEMLRQRTQYVSISPNHR